MKTTSKAQKKTSTATLTDLKPRRSPKGGDQVLNIGSQSSGAGAGKVTFNPFSITRK
jgi:hypothetical protein